MTKEQKQTIRNATRRTKRLIGRRITAVELNPYEGLYDDAIADTHVAYDPRITLDDGTKLQFAVQETNDEWWGVELVAYRPPSRKERRTKNGTLD